MELSSLHTHTEIEIKAGRDIKELGQEKGSSLAALSSWTRLYK